MPTLNKSARIPPLNSLRFIPANKALPAQYNKWPFDQGFFYQQIIKYFQQPVVYYQKVNTDQVITIYLDCLADNIKIDIIDPDGNLIVNVVPTGGSFYTILGNVDSVFGDQFHTFCYQFNPTTYSLPDGIYHVVVTALYTGDTDPLTDTMYVSEGFHVRDRWDNTLLLTYQHNENDYDVLFDPSFILIPKPWAFRIEAFLDEDPASHDTSFEDMLYQVEPLQIVPYRVGELIIGGNSGVPTWVLDKANRILACDTFTIDGVQWQKEPGTSWSIKKADNYPMKCGTIKLRDNPEVSEWEFNNSGEDDTFRIHTDEFSDEFN